MNASRVCGLKIVNGNGKSPFDRTTFLVSSPPICQLCEIEPLHDDVYLRHALLNLRTTRREYLALVGSFLIIFLESLVRIITLGLREFCSPGGQVHV